jgi:GT2 family glycosyltransferase
MISVVYLVRFRKGKKFADDINDLKKFYFSYCSHKAGVAHKLFILIKGPAVDEIISIIRKIIPANISLIKTKDEGYEFGSFTEFARYRADGYMFILNQYSSVLNQNWLKKYYNVLKKSKSEIVATTASMSSLSDVVVGSYYDKDKFSRYLIFLFNKIKSKYLFNSFPKYPNPHIRTNAILVKTSLWLEYFSNLEIKSKNQCYEIESGKSSFYNFLIKKGEKIPIVRNDGRYTTNYLEWKDFVPFRNSQQESKLIISDNHTEFYKNASAEKKKYLENETWRQDINFKINYKKIKNVKADVIIVNWNSGIHLKKCIDSIIKYNSITISKIIIVDNNSSDQSMNNLPDNKLIKIIKEKKNHGFAKACNIGAKYSNAKYLLFLNPDTRFLDKNSIANSLLFMEAPVNSKTAICGAQMVKNKNTVASCSYFPNPLKIFIYSTGLDKIFKIDSMLMNNFNHKKSMFVDQVIGAFFLIRSNIFFKLKGFDERFFLYFEDVDLSLRVSKLGYNSFYNADSICHHMGGVSSGNNLSLSLSNSLISRLIYSKKYFSFYENIFVIFCTFIIELFSRLIYSLVKFSYKNIKVIFVAYYYTLIFIFFKKNVFKN